MRDRIFPASPLRIHALAVLPLENLSADPAQEYFADGMTDELITMLAKNANLRVVSRTSVMQYKKVHRPLPEVARELGVDGILEGSVERSGSRVHINTQLIYAPQDRHLWAESYDRDLNDLASLQSELARTIARQVGLTTTAPARPEPRINPEAHDAYLLGRYYWFGRQDLKSREYFLKAIQLQPDYASAHAALSDSYVGAVVGGAPKAELQEAMTKGEQEARQAIALDDSDADAHHSMAAFDFFLAWNPQAAERESARSIELNPRYSESHHLRAYILSALQRTRKRFRKTASVWRSTLASTLGRWDSHCFAPDNTMPPSLNCVLGPRCSQTTMTSTGFCRISTGTKVWRPSPFMNWRRPTCPRVPLNWRPLTGRVAPAASSNGRLPHWKKVHPGEYVSPLDLALKHGQLRHKDEALRYLEQAYAEHVPWLIFIQSEPDLDFLHSDPRLPGHCEEVGVFHKLHEESRAYL